MRNCTSRFAIAAVAACLSTACTGDPSAPSGGGGTTPQVTAPVLDAPGDDEQLTTLRPTLVVRNGSSSATGTRTYEFQISTSSAFSPIAATRSGIAENASGKTSYIPDADLQSTTRYYWRARAAQGTGSSEWTAVGRFRTKPVGYNNARELYDPLIGGETVGTIFGPTTWVPGKGLKLNSSTSYVRYALPATVSSGEFSMEIEGLAPGGSIGKPRLFSMLDGTGRLDLSKFQMNVQYRGLQGNPDNCIAFKAVWGDEDVKLEPELHERHQSVIGLDPSKTYFWQATWTANEFRLVVRDGGPAGTVIYNRSKTSLPGYGPYAPTPHFAYLGANEAAMGGEDGTFPGVTIRNVWLGDKQRPPSLGSAIRHR